MTATSLVSRRRIAGLVVALAAVAAVPAGAQQWRNGGPDPQTNQSMFRPLEDWPAPNEYRAASGYPGPKYWQQRADYVIRATLDTVNHSVTGSERITYHNNSPDTLRFLWLQLDQNIVSREHSRSYQAREALPEKLSPQALEFLGAEPFDGGHKITRVQLVTPSRTGKGAATLTDAVYRINGTVMKVNLARPLAPGGQVQLEIDWSFRVPDNGRGAKEKVRDGWLYEIAQWFPRMSVYDDVNGWQTDQYLGRGEFYLNFGNYDVRLTVPANHIVEATGELQNPQEVLTPTQRQRLAQAYRSEEPVFIIRPDEVMTPASRPKQTGTLTWHFKAQNVRDFAWVSSKTYVWDAAGFRYRPTDTPIKVHSLYPRDAMPLWDSVSTRATIQTLKTYGRMAFEYPYPKAVNVHGPVFGMEYPMLAFCGARPNPDGTYSEQLARALISVTIHEVGHNWFPMIVATDERKHTWMDEGVNSFLQYYAEQDWEKGYPSRRGPAKKIVDYMLDPDQVPIMIHSDLIHKSFGDNGYGKPAAGLVMLREQILGEKAFDEAFQGYSRRWMFKHPQPADFFRSIEEGAGEDLAYFWRGWFYTTHYNDQAIVSVTSQPADSLIGTTARGSTYWRVRIENKGGLVLPVKMEIMFVDGSTTRVNLPADIWRNNEVTFTYGFFADKEVVKVVLDPDEVMADVAPENNRWEKGGRATS